MAVLSIGFADQIPIRQKRQSVGQVFDTLSCSPKIATAMSNCNKDLNERTKALREADISGDAGSCCYFAAFRQCVTSESSSHCGESTGRLVDSAIRAVQGAVMDKCSNYDYITPSCIFVMYYPWIIIAAVVLALVAIGCCLGACCC